MHPAYFGDPRASQPPRGAARFHLHALGRGAIKQMLSMQPRRADDLAYIEPARRDLGFAPRIPIAVGLPRFVAWYHGINEPTLGSRLDHIVPSQAESGEDIARINDQLTGFDQQPVKPVDAGRLKVVDTRIEWNAL